ncbi:uncharacterized protein LOC143226532 isoform X2 [Tachypleus tridentatus]|uniref:uncharacterized protein LOC143226532 isoform X2 n=1 Tax=Tachypleus tridentatus TaxID=6853 RepID=UPI003FD1A723
MVKTSGVGMVSEERDNLQEVVLHALKELGVRIPKTKKLKVIGKQDTRTERNVPNRQHFGISLLDQEWEVVEKTGVVVPRFLAMATKHLLKSSSTEGLFRKTGSVVRQRNLKSHLENGGSIDEAHANDVATLLKQWFRELPEPVIPCHLHDIFIRCLQLEDKETQVNAILLACLLLAPENLHTLCHTFQFLSTLAAQSTSNKMDAHNLALVMAPNLLPLSECAEKASNKFMCHETEIIYRLIENASQVGKVPDFLVGKLGLHQLPNHSEDELEKSGDVIEEPPRSKKKRRSGNFQEFVSGLRKIVHVRTPTRSNPSRVLSEIDTPDVSHDNLGNSSTGTPVTRSGSKRKADADLPSLSASKKPALAETLTKVPVVYLDKRNISSQSPFSQNTGEKKTEVCSSPYTSYGVQTSSCEGRRKSLSFFNAKHKKRTCRRADITKTSPGKKYRQEKTRHQLAETVPQVFRHHQDSTTSGQVDLKPALPSEHTAVKLPSPQPSVEPHKVETRKLCVNISGNCNKSLNDSVTEKVESLSLHTPKSQLSHKYHGSESDVSSANPLNSRNVNFITFSKSPYRLRLHGSGFETDINISDCVDGDKKHQPDMVLQTETNSIVLIDPVLPNNTSRDLSFQEIKKENVSDIVKVSLSKEDCRMKENCTEPLTHVQQNVYTINNDKNSTTSTDTKYASENSVQTKFLRSNLSNVGLVKPSISVRKVGSVRRKHQGSFSLSEVNNTKKIVENDYNDQLKHPETPTVTTNCEHYAPKSSLRRGRPNTIKTGLPSDCRPKHNSDSLILYTSYLSPDFTVTDGNSVHQSESGGSLNKQSWNSPEVQGVVAKLMFEGDIPNERTRTEDDVFRVSVGLASDVTLVENTSQNTTWSNNNSSDISCTEISDFSSDVLTMFGIPTESQSELSGCSVQSLGLNKLFSINSNDAESNTETKVTHKKLSPSYSKEVSCNSTPHPSASEEGSIESVDKNDGNQSVTSFDSGLGGSITDERRTRKRKLDKCSSLPSMRCGKSKQCQKIQRSSTFSEFHSHTGAAFAPLTGETLQVLRKAGQILEIQTNSCIHESKELKPEKVQSKENTPLNEMKLSSSNFITPLENEGLTEKTQVLEESGQETKSQNNHYQQSEDPTKCMWVEAQNVLSEDLQQLENACDGTKRDSIVKLRIRNAGMVQASIVKYNSITASLHCTPSRLDRRSRRGTPHNTPIRVPSIFVRNSAFTRSLRDRPSGTGRVLRGQLPANLPLTGFPRRRSMSMDEGDRKKEKSKQDKTELRKTPATQRTGKNSSKHPSTLSPDSSTHKRPSPLKDNTNINKNDNNEKNQQIQTPKSGNDQLRPPRSKEFSRSSFKRRGSRRTPSQRSVVRDSEGFKTPTSQNIPLRRSPRLKKNSPALDEQILLSGVLPDEWEVNM